MTGAAHIFDGVINDIAEEDAEHIGIRLHKELAVSLGYHDLALDEMDPASDEAAFVLHGYEKLQGSSFAVENAAVGLGVSVEEDFDSIRSYNWICRQAFCPETFCGLDLAPGEEKTFSRRYTFYML